MPDEMTPEEVAQNVIDQWFQSAEYPGLIALRSRIKDALLTQAQTTEAERAVVEAAMRHYLYGGGYERPNDFFAQACQRLHALRAAEQEIARLRERIESGKQAVELRERALAAAEQEIARLKAGR